MPKFIDKMNLPQYRYFQDMAVREEERKDMVSDFFTAQHQLNNGDQRGYRDGLMLLGRVRSRLPDFLYGQGKMPEGYGGKKYPGADEKDGKIY